MFVVFDLDGTLADCSHRLPHILEKTPKDWDTFFSLCYADRVIWPLANLARALLLDGHRVEIWSGRSEVAKQQTIDWLESISLRPWLLRMRAANDRRDDHELKMAWLEEISPIKPQLVFEDRSRVVQAWRERGVQCCQVNAYNNGDF